MRSLKRKLKAKIEALEPDKFYVISIPTATTEELNNISRFLRYQVSCSQLNIHGILVNHKITIEEIEEIMEERQWLNNRANNIAYGRSLERWLEEGE